MHGVRRISRLHAFPRPLSRAVGAVVHRYGTTGLTGCLTALLLVWHIVTPIHITSFERADASASGGSGRDLLTVIGARDFDLARFGLFGQRDGHGQHTVVVVG